jgi:thiol-disulfide isomerase/thioredoxin
MVLVTAGCAAAQAPRAHDFRLGDINPRSASHRRTLSLDELYRERGVVLKFIASWCESCRHELPQLETLSRSSRVPLVFVAADEHGPPDNLLIVAERAALSAPILYVPESEVERFEAHYTHETLPAAYLIDTEGRIRSVLQGAVGLPRLVEEIGRTLER